mmetsp:Transcript_72355/g.172814  ORF Transcript_72355/g.172814 Transcript_72355/m.172814 type:complete len:275 (-) Transcript_72355:1821-2645(-)
MCLLKTWRWPSGRPWAVLALIRSRPSGRGCRSRARSTPFSSVPIGIEITLGITSALQMARSMALFTKGSRTGLLLTIWAKCLYSMASLGGFRKHKTRPPITGVCAKRGSKRMAISPLTCKRWIPTLIPMTLSSISESESSFTPSRISDPCMMSLPSLPQRSGASEILIGPKTGVFMPSLNLLKWMPFRRDGTAACIFCVTEPSWSSISRWTKVAIFGHKRAKKALNQSRDSTEPVHLVVSRHKGGCKLKPNLLVDVLWEGVRMSSGNNWHRFLM